jgi:hypothetical protein
MEHTIIIEISDNIFKNVYKWLLYGLRYKIYKIEIEYTEIIALSWKLDELLPKKMDKIINNFLI